MGSEGTLLDKETVTKGVTAAMNDENKGLYYVARVDGKAVGSLMLTREWSDWNNGWYWWIQSVYVAPEYRRQGIYKSMYHTVCEDAKQQNVAQVRLYVDKTNTRGQNVYSALGIFEQSHYLMEIQNCLMAFYEYPDEMHEILDVITQFELDLAAEICKYIKPDALFHHDDWGSQQSTFLSPAMFREFIKPCYEKVYGYYKAHGVELIIHHSDSYAATLVPDMIDLGIDIWQGVMTCNNIPELIKQYGGKISFMGGIDSATIDFPGWTVADVSLTSIPKCTPAWRG